MSNSVNPSRKITKYYRFVMTHEYGEWFMFAAIAIAILLSMTGACTYLNRQAGLKDDNVIEEYIETQIQQQTGIDIDLSGDSPE